MQPDRLIDGVFEFVLLIFSLSVHECAHAWMASRLGDQTARLQGRVTLNPMYHVDPIGTLLFPALMIFGSGGGFLVGWAKPTPVITRNFRKLVRDDSLVTLAGPVSNLLLGFIAFFGLAILIVFQHHAALSALQVSESTATNLNGLFRLFYLALKVNLALFFFNLLPIPPLDGSRVVRHWLPYGALKAFDNMGMFSYVLMILAGGPIVGFLMGPAMRLVTLGLSLAA